MGLTVLRFGQRRPFLGVPTVLRFGHIHYAIGVTPHRRLVVRSDAPQARAGGGTDPRGGMQNIRGGRIGHRRAKRHRLNSE